MTSNNRCSSIASIPLAASALLVLPAQAQGRAEDLATKLSNPVAALVSVKLQLNYDQDIGPVEGGKRWVLNVQPVVPIDLDARWNLISRTIVPLVKQEDIFPGAGGWTYGALANHVGSFAGDDNRSDVNSTFVQPFLSYSTPTALTFAVNTESTCDSNARQWSVPLNASVSQVTKFGDPLVSLGGGLRHWADSPQSGPHGLGFRFVVTLLFPR